MATMILDCPHCGTKKSGFTPQNDFPVPAIDQGWAVTGLCNGCRKPVCVTLFGHGMAAHRGVRPLQSDGNVLNNDAYRALAIYPEPHRHEAPLGVPEAVNNAFKQGSASRQAGHYDAACSMYRKAMELGLKAFSPDIDAWKIEKRIDKMAKENRITPEIQAWAHELRLDGNEALHGDGEATKDMADQMHELCKFLLIYLYTLPAQVAEAQARRAGE